MFFDVFRFRDLRNFLNFFIRAAADRQLSRRRGAATAVAACRGRGGKDFGSAAARKKKIKIFTKTWKPQKLQKTSIKSIKNDKNIDFGGARNKRTWPSNSTRKTTYIDLFSCLYDRKWSKTLPVHVRKRSYVSVHNRMYASVFYALVLHIGVWRVHASKLHASRWH